jgi:type I restriction enzyme M protein
MEAAARKMNDYPVFMAVVDHIGHDKRGNTLYVRDARGNEIIDELDEQVKEWANGTPVYRKQKTRRKVLDDNTLQIAQEFRRWLSEQD